MRTTDQILRDFMLEYVAEWRRCREHRLYIAASMMRREILATLDSVGGMAGVW